jgi:hypothetical protein
MASAAFTPEELSKQQDEVLRKLAQEAVTQGGNLRKAVRDLTLQGLRIRELSLSQIRQVIQSVSEGVNLGAEDKKTGAHKALEDALAGMDDALRRTVQANRLALEQLTVAGQNFEESHLKKAMDDLEQLEDGFLTTIHEAADHANADIKKQWTSILKNVKAGDTETGGQVTTTLDAFNKFTEQSHQAFQDSRRAGLKAAYKLTQNFATLASGVLIGLSEALQGSEATEPPPAAARTGSAKRKTAKPGASRAKGK